LRRHWGRIITRAVVKDAAVLCAKPDMSTIAQIKDSL